jgi:putative membrane protein
MVKSVLSESDAREVEAAIARVERASSAELVVAIVPRSDEYLGPRGTVALAWGIGAALMFLLLEPWREPALALLIELVVGALVFAATAWPALTRRLVPREVSERAAAARAFQLFAERGLYATRNRTALLIFVSELEHRVILLGDQTIHAELGAAGWEREVAKLVSALRAGRARAGLLEVIADLEPKLATVAPPRAGDADELPNRVLRG